MCGEPKQVSWAAAARAAASGRLSLLRRSGQRNARAAGVWSQGIGGGLLPAGDAATAPSILDTSCTGRGSLTARQRQLDLCRVGRLGTQQRLESGLHSDLRERTLRERR